MPVDAMQLVVLKEIRNCRRPTNMVVLQSWQSNMSMWTCASGTVEEFTIADVTTTHDEIAASRDLRAHDLEYTHHQNWKWALLSNTRMAQNCGSFSDPIHQQNLASLRVEYIHHPELLNPWAIICYLLNKWDHYLAAWRSLNFADAVCAYALA